MTTEEKHAQLKQLYDTWPSDGWDGAADVIAAHARKAHEIETALAEEHKLSGQHGPRHPFYLDACVCRYRPVMQRVMLPDLIAAGLPSGDTPIVSRENSGGSDER